MLTFEPSPPSLEHDPDTLDEAMARADWPQWKAAYEKELAGFWQKKVEKFAYTDGLVVKCRDIFKRKYHADNTLDKYKDQIVA